ncbi:MAG: hypothetical protein IPG45_32720 [Deltaproteobacteria bacterium]|nr:hypothetical protein [Deltaproteobacteria bacterium]
MAHPTLRFAAAAALVCGACVEPRPLDWSAFAGARSAILAWRQDDQRVLHALRAGGDPPVLHRSNQAIYLVTFDETLEQLGFKEGPLQGQGQGVRPWPNTSRPLVLRPDTDAFQVLSLEDLTAELGERVLPGLSPSECLDRDGCYRFASPRGTECEAPCAEQAEITPPEPPRPPASPTLAPCAAAWLPRLAEGVTVCDPPAVLDCPNGSRAGWAGACVPSGGPCAAGPFPVAPGPSIYFVAAGGPAGDGSLNTPFNDLTTALASVPPGATLALGEGRFSAGLRARAPVKLVGLCPARSTLVAPSGQVAFSVSRGVEVELEGLSLEGAAGQVVLASRGDLEVQAVELRGGAYGLVGRGGAIHGAELRIAGAAREALDVDGARLDLAQLEVHGPGGVRLGALIDGSLRDYWSEGAGGVRLQSGALTLERAFFRGHRGGAIEGPAGVSLVVRDLEVVGDLAAHGVWLGAGSILIGERLHLVDTSTGAIRVGADWEDGWVPVAGSCRLSDVVVEGGLVRSLVATAVQLQLERGLFRRGTGVALDVPFSEALLTDVTALDIGATAAGDFGSGIIADGTNLRVERARLEGFQWAVIRAYSDREAIGAAHLIDVLVRGSPNLGIEIFTPVVSMTRVDVREVLQGVQVGQPNRPPPISNLTDLGIRDTQGIGLRMYSGESTVHRLAIERTFVTGILLDQVSVVGEDFRVETIPISVDVKPALQGVALGVGPGFVTGDLEFASIALERFFFRGSGAAGIWLGLNAETQLTGGWIEGFSDSVSTAKLDFDLGLELSGIRMPTPDDSASN